MVKIKFDREELQCLCWLTNPMYLEPQVMMEIRMDNFYFLGDQFNLIELGVRAAKKLLFDHKKAYKISFTYAQAAAFWNYSGWNENALDDYKRHFIESVKNQLHHALTNYQRQYYGKNR